MKYTLHVVTLGSQEVWGVSNSVSADPSLDTAVYGFRHVIITVSYGALAYFVYLRLRVTDEWARSRRSS